MQENMQEKKIHDVYDLRKRLVQNCFDFDRNIINAVVTIWDHVCMLVVDALWTHAVTWMFIYMIHQHIL